MARKSQVKAIAARAKQSAVVQPDPVVPPVPKDASSAVATATLTRAAKKKHVQRAKSLTKTAPSPLAVRMQQDLQLTGKGEATQDSYLRAVRKLAVFACKSPDLIDEEELRAYFYYIRNDQMWEPSTIRVAYSGIKFFYSHTCPRDWDTLKYLRVEDVLKLPTVLSLDDTRKLLDSIRLPCHHAFFWTVYSMGLRILALSKIYRAKVRDALREAGLLALFPEAVWQAEWVVHSKAVGDGRAAMKYLAPYIFRVAISDRRIRSIAPGPDGQGQVVYEYRPSGTRQSKTLPVSAEEFIRRFLQHVLPSGFRKVRHYGLASARREMDVELLKWLVTITLQMVYVITIGARPVIAKPSAKCRYCGGHLRLYGVTLPTVIGYDTS